MEKPLVIDVRMESVVDLLRIDLPTLRYDTLDIELVIDLRDESVRMPVVIHGIEQHVFRRHLVWFQDDYYTHSAKAPFTASIYFSRVVPVRPGAVLTSRT